MIARKVNEDRVILPRAIALRFADVESFDVASDGDSITLRAHHQSAADKARDQLQGVGITDQDIADAVAWARSEQ